MYSLASPPPALSAEATTSALSQSKAPLPYDIRSSWHRPPCPTKCLHFYLWFGKRFSILRHPQLLSIQATWRLICGQQRLVIDNGANTANSSSSDCIDFCPANSTGLSAARASPASAPSTPPQQKLLLQFLPPTPSFECPNYLSGTLSLRQPP